MLKTRRKMDEHGRQLNKLGLPKRGPADISNQLKSKMRKVAVPYRQLKRELEDRLNNHTGLIYGRRTPITQQDVPIVESIQKQIGRIESEMKKAMLAVSLE